MGDVIIAGEKCESCQYGTVEEQSKARVLAHCSIKEKAYLWGQCIPCDEYKKVKIERE